ncbi:MAG: hypothetical protein RLZZ46_401 [Bacteroidota bacterium]
MRFLWILTLMPALFFGACKSSRKAGTSTDDLKGNRNIASPLNKNDLELIHYFHNATRDKLLGNYEEAIRNYRRCLNINPAHAPSSYELGMMYLTAGDPVAAEPYAKVAYTSDPANVWYAKVYLSALKENRRYPEAIKIYNNLEKLYPDNTEFYNEHSSLCLLANRNSDALDVLEKLEQKSGLTLEIVELRKKIYLKEGKPEKAIAAVKQYIESWPDDYRANLILAQIYQFLGRGNEELAELKAALVKAPGNAEVNLNIAEHYRVLRNYESALPYLKEAFSSPDLDIDNKIKILLGMFLITESNTGLRGAAYELLDIAVLAHPSDPKVYSMYGDFCFRDKNYEKARDSFRKAIALDNSKYAVWSQLFIVESELGDFDSMIAEAKVAQELFPNEPTILLFMGIAQLQKKQPGEAAKNLENGLKLVVDNPALEAQFYANLGDAYHRAKLYGKSDDAYEAALKINPDDSYVLNNYAYYLSLRKENLARAAEMSKKTVDMFPQNPSYLDTYGWILYTQEKFKEAEPWLAKAVKAGSTPSAVILEHYGDVLYRLEDRNGALEYWRKAKEAGQASELLDQKIRELRLIE